MEDEAIGELGISSTELVETGAVLLGEIGAGLLEIMMALDDSSNTLVDTAIELEENGIELEDTTTKALLEVAMEDAINMADDDEDVYDRVRVPVYDENDKNPELGEEELPTTMTEEDATTELTIKLTSDEETSMVEKAIVLVGTSILDTLELLAGAIEVLPSAVLDTDTTMPAGEEEATGTDIETDIDTIALLAPTEIT